MRLTSQLSARRRKKKIEKKIKKVSGAKMLEFQGENYQSEVERSSDRLVQGPGQGQGLVQGQGQGGTVSPHLLASAVRTPMPMPSRQHHC